MRISRQASVLFLQYIYRHTHTYWHCKMLHFSDLISLPLPDLQILFHRLFVNYKSHFTACFSSTFIISLTVPDRQFSFHCLFVIYNSHFTLCSWSTVLISTASFSSTDFISPPLPPPRLTYTGQKKLWWMTNKLKTKYKQLNCYI
jgi:hypothetical protein